jgi:predicted RNA-binding Zn ribbon-like protein
MVDPLRAPWPGVDTAGSLSLSLVNTLDWRLGPSPVELLRSPTDLLRWAWTAGALTPEAADVLAADGLHHPRRASQVLREAIQLREALAEVVLAVASGEPVPKPALQIVDRACREARAAQHLVIGRDRLGWTWRQKTPEPRRPLWAAALDASGLLTSDRVARIRQCHDSECGWFFLDTSRNRSRRWCSMDGCGNRSKARAFYRRTRGGR